MRWMRRCNYERKVISKKRGSSGNLKRIDPLNWYYLDISFAGQMHQSQRWIFMYANNDTRLSTRGRLRNFRKNLTQLAHAFAPSVYAHGRVFARIDPWYASIRGICMLECARACMHARMHERGNGCEPGVPRGMKTEGGRYDLSPA